MRQSRKQSRPIVDFMWGDKKDAPTPIMQARAEMYLIEEFGSLVRARGAYNTWLAFCDSEHPEAGRVEADISGWCKAERGAIEEAYRDRGYAPDDVWIVMS